jgi:hypothetical protein
MEIEIVPGQAQNVQTALRRLLFGGKETSAATFKAAMKTLAAERTRRFKERIELRRQAAKHFEMLQAPLVDKLKNNEHAAEALRGLRKINDGLAKRALVAPSVPPEKPRFFTGSMGSVVVPPCYFPYSDDDTISGSPGVVKHVTFGNGTMGFNLTGGSDESSAVVHEGLGIYFYPPSPGHLIVQANPGYSGGWNYTCWLHEAITTAMIGLDVLELDLHNEFQRLVRRDPHALWNEDHSPVAGSGSGDASSPALPLFAELDVDTQHHYMLVVWCAGSTESYGGGALGNSSATSQLEVTVPSIRWELS